MSDFSSACLSNSPAAVIVEHDAYGKIWASSRLAEVMFGGHSDYAPLESMEMFMTLVHADDLSTFKSARSALINGSQQCHMEIKIKVFSRDYDIYRWFNVVGRTSTDAGKPILIWYLTENEEFVKLRREIDNIGMFVNGSPTPIFRLNMDGIVIYANEASVELLDTWSIGLGQRMSPVVIDAIFPYFESTKAIEMDFPCGGKLYSLNFVYIKSNNYVNVYGMDITERRLVNEELVKKRDEFRLLNRDLQIEIMERKKVEEKLREQSEKMRRMAQYDFLTGLPNRTLFDDRLTVAIEYAKRNKRVLGVMMIDLDKFKLINDNHGHDAGDALLVEVSNRLLKCVRGTDTVARLGGDEYAILATDLHDVENAVSGCESICEKILAALSVPIIHNGIELKSTPSIGVTIVEDLDTSKAVMMKRADIGLYESKRTGRNNYHFYSQGMGE